MKEAFLGPSGQILWGRIAVVGLGGLAVAGAGVGAGYALRRYRDNKLLASQPDAAQLQAGLTEAQRQFAQAQADLTAKRAEFDRCHTDLVTAQASGVTKDSTIAGLREQLATAATNLTTAQNARDAAQGLLDTCQRNLTAAPTQAALDGCNTARQTAVDDLATCNTARQTAVDDLATCNTARQTAVDDLAAAPTRSSLEDCRRDLEAALEAMNADGAGAEDGAGARGGIRGGIGSRTPKAGVTIIPRRVTSPDPLAGVETWI